MAKAGINGRAVLRRAFRLLCIGNIQLCSILIETTWIQQPPPQAYSEDRHQKGCCWIGVVAHVRADGRSGNRHRGIEMNARVRIGVGHGLDKTVEAQLVCLGLGPQNIITAIKRSKSERSRLAFLPPGVSESQVERRAENWKRAVVNPCWAGAL